MKAKLKRKIDELGRIVIPIALREKFDISENDKMEIHIENDKIILRKYQPSCIFCGNTKEIKEFKDKLICTKCIGKIITYHSNWAFIIELYQKLDN